MAHNESIPASTSIAPPSSVRRGFRRARPFPHAVVDGFVPEALYAAVLKETASLRPSKDARGYDGRLLERGPARLGPACAELDAFLRSPALTAWVEDAVGLKGLVRNPAPTCGGIFRDAHGSGLDPHLDVNCTVAGRRRVAALVVYLNERWDAAWGGELELYADPERSASASHLPLPRRAALLDTRDGSWHGVARVDLPPARRVLARRAWIVNFYGAGRERPRFNTWLPREPARRLELLRELRGLELAAAPGRPRAPREDLTAEELAAELKRLYGREHAWRSRLESR